MVRVARQTDARRLAELKQKINDDLYIDTAIRRIAATLTEEIISSSEESSESATKKR